MPSDPAEIILDETSNVNQNIGKAHKQEANGISQVNKCKLPRERET